jgi:hypothetical protein
MTKPKKPYNFVARVIKAKPGQDDARDDGPRLIPLMEKKGTFENHSLKYLELADIALKNEK